MNEQIWWYLSRSSGMVAAVLLVLSLVWGAFMATRALRPLDRPAWMLAMHRWFSGLAVVGVIIHLASLVADNYVHFGVKELLVPMASTWKPGAVAIGVVSTYLFVLVQSTSLAMKHLPKRVWRGIHLTSYLMTWMVFMHAGLAGTDVSNRVYQAVALLLAILAVTATMLRVLLGRFGDRRGAAQAVPAAGASQPVRSSDAA